MSTNTINLIKHNVPNGAKNGKRDDGTKVPPKNTINLINRDAKKRDTNETCSCLTSGQKWIAALIAAIVFALISCLPAYRLTSLISTSMGGPALMTGGPNLAGLIIHTIVFFLIIRLILF